MTIAAGTRGKELSDWGRKGLPGKVYRQRQERALRKCRQTRSTTGSDLPSSRRVRHVRPAIDEVLGIGPWQKGSMRGSRRRAWTGPRAFRFATSGSETLTLNSGASVGDWRRVPTSEAARHIVGNDLFDSVSWLRYPGLNPEGSVRGPDAACASRSPPTKQPLTFGSST
jgi:hypothetical protein